MSYLIPKNSTGTIQPIAEVIGGHTFPEGISPKVNVITRLEIELAYYDVAVQFVSLYANGIPSHTYICVSPKCSVIAS